MRQPLSAGNRAILRFGVLSVLLLSCVHGAAWSQTFTQIVGSPLRINVGADSSFQIFNSNVSAGGQIFPSDCTALADMGVFLRDGATLYSPSFSTHVSTPTCNTATSFGPSTPWANQSVGAVSGNGTTSTPYTVIVNGDASPANVHLKMTVTYLNGDAFFRKLLEFTNNSGAAKCLSVYLGSDLSLANSDDGIPRFDPSVNGVGGVDCSNSGYSILHIPLTPASAYSARQFSTVWQEIGAGNLTNIVAPGCIDDGAALQWQNVCLQPGETRRILAATTFGQVPQIIYAVILLDRTGSMTALRSTGNSRCKDALTQSVNDVNDFFATPNAGAVAIWTFGGGFQQLTGFVDKQTALDALNALNPEGCSPDTPLADAICSASDFLAASFTGSALVQKQLFVNSDGGENASVGTCSGAGSAGGTDCPTYDTGSWQRKVCDHLSGLSVANMRFWGAFGMVPKDGQVDTETGGVRLLSVLDSNFFQSLAAKTGGRYTFIADSDSSYPRHIPLFPVNVPTLSETGLMLLSLAVVGGAYWLLARLG